jgi:hypothetical protein
MRARPYSRTCQSANEKAQTRVSRQTEQTAVRASTIVMIGFAVDFGLLAVFIAQV